MRSQESVASMSWFKQKIGGSIRHDKFSSSSLSPSAVRSGGGSVAEQTRNERNHGTDGRFPANSTDGMNHVVDLQVTESHWNTASSVLLRSSSTWQDDDWTVVLSFCDEVVTALSADEHSTYLQLTDFLLSSEVLEKLVACLVPPTTSTSPGRSERLRSCLLRLFDLLLSQSSEASLLTERRLTKPLLRLLAICGGTSGESVDGHLIGVLHQLCVGITQFPAVLDLLFGGDVTGKTGDENGAADGEKTSSQFLVFSLLVPFVHREGRAAQQARDDLLLIMSLSSALISISRHIVDHSDFCPVSQKAWLALLSSHSHILCFKLRIMQGYRAVHFCGRISIFL